MRAVIQRVKRASVTVDGQIVSSIGKGLVVFVAVKKDDVWNDFVKFSRKIEGLRVFDDENGKMWAKSLKTLPEHELLLVSQFTLYGDMRKGTRPDLHLSAKSEEAKATYSRFVDTCRELLGAERVKDGVFGAMMDVELVNDGPVTLQFDLED